MSDKGSILAVDDTFASLKLLTDVLTTAGYRVRPADSSALALASAIASPPDLVLLDVHMPEMDGFEVLRRLKNSEVTRNIPVIFISGTSELKQRVQCMTLGAADFLEKPFIREELLARVKTHIQIYQMRLLLERQVGHLQRENEQLRKELQAHDQKHTTTPQ